MSGIEIVSIIGGIVAGLASGISSFLHWRKSIKTRRDILEIKEHVRPKIIIQESAGTLTPKDSEELQDINIGRFEEVKLYYDREANQYFENLPIETPRAVGAQTKPY